MSCFGLVHPTGAGRPVLIRVNCPGFNREGKWKGINPLLPIKYTDELKTRAIELVLHAQANPDTSNGAITRVANELGLSSETLRTWVRRHKNSGIEAPARSVDLEAENKRLRAELAESKRTNDILKKTAAFFAAELDRPSKSLSTSSTTTKMSSGSSRSSTRWKEPTHRSP